MNNPYTENMADIMSCSRERQEMFGILAAWDKHGLPGDFSEDGIRFAFNKNSGYVFLINDDYQVAMVNGYKLDSFYTSPYDGHEGFLDDLIEAAKSDSWHDEDINWLNDIKEMQQ